MENKALIEKIRFLETKIENLENLVENRKVNSRGKKFRGLFSSIRISIVVMFSILLIGSLVYAANEIPFLFMNGQIADADEINYNFQYVIDRLWEKTDAGLSFLEGDLGVKTENPDTDLDVAGSIAIDAGSSFYLEGSEGDTGDTYITYETSNERVAIIENGAEAISIKGNNVGIGNPEPTAKLDVNGGIKSTSLSVNGSVEVGSVNSREIISRGSYIIKDVKVVYGGSSTRCGSGWHQSVDLNRGAGGDYIYLCFKRAN